MEKNKISLDAIQKIYGNIYIPLKEKERFNNEKKYADLSFDDFIMVMNDYYLFKYANRIGRNAFLVFEWLKYLTRKDGFVCISYSEVMLLFCSGGGGISKPTFFKCIDELVAVGIVYRIPTFRVQDERVSNDSNVYAIADKSDIVYKVCDIVQETNYSYSSVFSMVDDNGSNINIPEKIKESRKKQSHQAKYKLFGIKFKKIWDDIETFFVFLGSFNKSGSIAMARKVKILDEIKPFMDGGFTFEDIVYAIKTTMKNTSKSSSNGRKERYFFSILYNQCEEDDGPNDVAVKLGKQAEADLALSYKGKQGKGRYGISKEEFYVQATQLKTIEGHFRTVCAKFSSPVNEYEETLKKAATLISNKFDCFRENASIRAARMRLLGNSKIYECIEYDSNWNRVISWCDDKNKDISLNVVKKIIGKVVVSKYDKIKG